MQYSIYPTYDSTIYSIHSKRNTGIDQILELSKLVPGVPDEDGFTYDGIYNSRILIAFNISEIQQLLESGTIPQSARYFLEMKGSSAEELPISYSLDIHAVSQSWDNGQGHLNDYPEIDTGVSWVYRDGYYQGNGTKWISGAFNSNTTGSYIQTQGGGTWHTTPSSNVSFNYNTNPDYEAEVTNIVKEWLTGSIANNGFIIKRTTEDENSSQHLGKLSFFSKDSHTIYIPKINIKWDQSTHTDTGSLQIVDKDCVVYLPNIKKEYNNNIKARFRVKTRDQYPKFSYVTSSYYSYVKRLPTSSFYAIKDSITEEYIVPFNEEFTKLSTDSQGNYFDLYTSTLMPERYYTVVLKVRHQDGTEQVINNGYHFKVVR